ncbi:MAG TPA: AtpZ/AtpI family protein [Methanothrix sp.]|jgi:ATP synthase protein I|nr:AtpZ/AtpI family protein [Methanothrix sp.]
MDDHRKSFEDEIAAKEARKIKARRGRARGIWFGLGMMGVIGWSVAVPALVGVLLGVWIDINYPGPVSWTLTLLFVGLAVGCVNAWYWIKKEQKEIEVDNINE